MACVALLGLVACGGDNPPVITVDSGTGTDSGPVGTPDSGPRPDAGTPDTCPAASAPAPTAGDTCAAATYTCIMGATSEAAYQACLDADPMPMPCAQCLSAEAIASCSAAGVCDDEFGEVLCCVRDECPAGSPATCQQTALSGACATDWNAFVGCANGATCGNTPTFCFAEAATFFPSYDRAELPFYPALMSLPYSITQR